jgi:hypothetical protein
MTSRRADRRRLLDELVAIVRTADLDQSRRRLEATRPADVEALIAAARAHGVEAWLAACAPAGAQWSELHAQRPRFSAARVRSLSAVQGIGRQLDDLGCPWAVLKGISLSYGAYPRPDLRHSVDVDILVSGRYFAEALAALEGSGHRLLDVNWPLLAEQQPGQLRLQAPNRTIVDLHWHLLNQRELRESFRLPTEPLLARAVGHADPEFPMLAPIDQLLHVALHAALSGATKLVWLVDLDRLLSTGSFDWAELTAAAHSAGVGLPVAIALARAAAVMDSPVPHEVLIELAGGKPWLGLERLADRGGALRLDPADPSLSRVVARSARTTSGQTGAELLRHGWGWVRSGAPRRLRAGDWLDPANPNSALYPVPNEAARDRYLSAVKRTPEALLNR